jgi:hypothetical protein
VAHGFPRWNHSQAGGAGRRRCPPRPTGTVIPVAAPSPALAGPPITRGYVLHLQARLLEAEVRLVAMNEKYEHVKAHFDRTYARQGITPDIDIVSYQNVRAQHPELKYWYAKVEHFQREVAAYGAALTGLEASCRMLGSERNTAEANNGRVRDRRRSLYRAS